jgi:hypothetical protein
VCVPTTRWGASRPRLERGGEQGADQARPVTAGGKVRDDGVLQRLLR